MVTRPQKKPGAAPAGFNGAPPAPRRDMRLQVVSDLHLERRDRRPDAARIPHAAPHLALLGDIGDPFSVGYAELLREAARRFDTVLLVLGNHEHYHNRASALGRARDLAGRYPNVHALEKDSVQVEGFRVLGTTLWSDVDPACAGRLSDHRCIYGWDHARGQEEHRGCVAWLRARLADPDPGECVVLTHHAPLRGFTSSEKHADSATRSAFATDLSDLVAPPVRAWFHGHTHWCHETVVVPPGGGHGVLVASNAAGLAGDPAQAPGRGYDPAKVFDITPRNITPRPPPRRKRARDGDDV
jgi:predicted phosphodiesterase